MCVCVCVRVCALRHSNFCNSSRVVFITELREMTVIEENFREITECPFLQQPSRKTVLPAPLRSQPNWRLHAENNFFFSEVEGSCAPLMSL
jgi:hypothetical protein